MPPIGLAIIVGAIAVWLSGSSQPHTVSWNLPVLVLAEPEFSAPAILGVALPMVVLAMGLGNVQGLGFLLS